MGEPPSSCGALHDKEAVVAVIFFASSNLGGPGTPEQNIIWLLKTDTN